MEPIKITDSVYWVGGIDWKLRSFHGYRTPRGSTYNAYLIIDEKVTLIDTVKSYLVDELIARVSKIIDPSKIDYIISNHVEMDHSGGIPRLMELAPNAVIYTSFPNGEKGLKRHYKKDFNFKPVKTGDSLNIGKRTLSFVTVPMIHWPDNMITYSAYDKILFSNDAFGQHIASTQRFDDEIGLDILIEEAKSYYANIVLPYGAQVQGALKVVSALDIEVICPSHGLLIRSYIQGVLNSYADWCVCKDDGTAIVVYDTMWGSTEKMAYAVMNAFEAKGIKARLFGLQQDHYSDIMTHAMTAKYICVGSPTLNNNMLPTVAAFLTYMKGLAPKGKIGFAFGSYGWSGQSVGQVEEALKECKFELLDNFVRIPYIPDEEELDKLTAQLIEKIHVEFFS